MNNLISINQIYDFFCNYQLPSEYIAILRVFTVGSIALYYLFILPDILLLIDYKNGMFPHDKYLKFCKEKYPQISLYNQFGGSVFWSYGILIIFFISAITVCLGLFTSLSLWIFLICMCSLQSRIFPIIYTSGDIVARFLVLSLCFTDCSTAYSIDSILGLSKNLPYIDGWAIRLSQLTIACGAYFGSGLRKINDYYWVRGEALYNAINSHLFGMKNKISILDSIIVYKSLNYFVLLFELFSPIIFFVNETCGIALCMGLLLHIGILIFMRIGFFCLIMFVSLLYFYEGWIQIIGFLKNII